MEIICDLHVGSLADNLFESEVSTFFDAWIEDVDPAKGVAIIAVDFDKLDVEYDTSEYSEVSEAWGVKQVDNYVEVNVTKCEYKGYPVLGLESVAEFIQEAF